MKQSKFYQIKNITEQEYTLVGCDGSVITHPIQDVDKSASAFTIQDAKDGDVLEFGDHGRLVTGILSFVNKTTGKVDVSCLLEGDKFKIGVFYNLDTVKPHPATKEQRDLLFQKMKEAGYEWDAEKKELRKIEQPKLTEFEDAIKDMMDDYRDAIDEHAATVEEVKERSAYLLSLIPQKSAEWSEEDEETLGWLCTFLKEYGNLFYGGNEENVIDWLKSFKDRVQQHPKQEWSEEDYRIFSMIATDVNLAHDVVRKGGADKERDRELAWLNFLRDQVLPHPKHKWSEEDEETLGWLCTFLKEYGNPFYGGNEENVINWLKSLKERYTWKPSDEQMYILKWVANILLHDNGVVEQEASKKLNSLYEDLKKL